MCGDGLKLDFGGKHSMVYTDTELLCIPETYIML